MPRVQITRQTSLATLFALSILLLPIALQAQVGGQNFVQLEISSQADGPLGQNQKWLETLAEVGADSVRMVQTVGSSRPDVQKTKTGRGTSYKIVGVINHRNQLILPGGRYSIRDTARIRAYIDSIRADGAEVALAEKLAFGLTAEQLVDVHTHLTPAYTETTLGRSPTEVLTSIRRVCQTPIIVDPAAAIALREDYLLEDDYRGLSIGTTLAAALRPLGLVAAPRREQGKQTEIMIVDSRSVAEHWPIGWPLEQRPDQAIPKLYDRIPVNIRNYTLQATLPAIQKAVEVPFLFDYNSMARAGVDLEKIRINLEAEKLSYQLVLRRAISQARPRMQLEIRADESGKPFIWFSAQ